MTLDSTRPLVVIALLALLGCKAETFGAEDPVVDPDALTIVGGTRLAGSLDTISAPWMSQVGDSIALIIDDASAAFAARVPGHPALFVIGLPAALRGERHELTLIRPGGVRIPIGSISTGGFTETRTAAGQIISPTQPDPNLPGIFGQGFAAAGTSCQAEAVDARRAVVVPIAAIPTCGYGIGATFHPGQFTTYLSWSGGNWARIGPTVGGPVVDSLQIYSTTWPTHELAPGLYLVDRKESTYFYSDAGGWSAPLGLGGYGHPQHIAFSEDSVWAVPSHSRSPDGLLIVDRRTGAYHWSAGWLNYTTPFFQSTGALVAYGWRAKSPGGAAQEIVAHVDVASGAILDSSYFAEAGSPYDLPVALSSTGWIIFSGYVGDHFELSVRDPVTLAEIAHPISGPVPNSCYSYTAWSVVEDPPLGRFYLVGNDCDHGIPIVTFQLPD